MAQENTYKGQILAVMNYLDDVLSQDWTHREEDFHKVTSVEHLAKVACMSKRLFQLMFHAYTHETIGAYKNRLRMEFAQVLLKDRMMNIHEISDSIGFANPPAFTNTFRKMYGLSPIERQRTFVEPKPEVAPKYREAYLKPLPVLFRSIVGSYDSCATMQFEEAVFDNLERCAFKLGISLKRPSYWGVAWDDERITASEQCRYYAAVEVADSEQVRLPITEEVKMKKLPEGHYAVFTYRGAYCGLGAFYERIFRTITFEIGLTPILEKYLNSPFEVAQRDLLTEIWIPLSNL